MMALKAWSEMPGKKAAQVRKNFFPILGMPYMIRSWTR